MSKIKKAFDDIDSRTIQDISREFISNHIYSNQSCLVNEMLYIEFIPIEDYINIYESDKEIKEIYEHWTCSDWFIEKMKEQDEPILESCLMVDWWGRTCTGQPIIWIENVQVIST